MTVMHKLILTFIYDIDIRTTEIYVNITCGDRGGGTGGILNINMNITTYSLIFGG